MAAFHHPGQIRIIPKPELIKGTLGGHFPDLKPPFGVNRSRRCYHRLPRSIASEWDSDRCLSKCQDCHTEGVNDPKEGEFKSTGSHDFTDSPTWIKLQNHMEFSN